MYINYDVINSTSKYFCFKKTYSFFADIIKIVTMFINTIFKDPQKLKELEIMCQNAIYRILDLL